MCVAVCRCVCCLLVNVIYVLNITVYFVCLYFYVCLFLDVYVMVFV